MAREHSEEMSPEEVRETAKQIDRFLGIVEGKLLDRLSPDGQTILLGLRRICIEVSQTDDVTLREIAFAFEQADG